MINTNEFTKADPTLVHNIIASVMPGTSAVESDFSLVNWREKDPHTQRMTDFTLESILHAKHIYMQLLAISMQEIFLIS